MQFGFNIRDGFCDLWFMGGRDVFDNRLNDPMSGLVTQMLDDGECM